MLVSYQQSSYYQSSYQSHSKIDSQPGNLSGNLGRVNENPDTERPSVELSDEAVRLSSQPIDKADGSKDSELLSGARNILSFINQGIASLVAEGADNAEILEKIDQATSGFFQGYGEAASELSESGLLDDTVSSTIEQLYDQVLDGIASLAENYGRENPGRERSGEVAADQPSNKAVEVTETTTTAAGPAGQLSASIEQFRDQRFAFELTTADGDKVSINAQYSSFSNLSVEGIDTLLNSSAESSRYQLNVEGQLDEGELTAINDLLDQVFSLAEDFYDGDIDAAYQAALDIGYDREEISQYALKLTQVDITATQVTYQRQPENSANPMNTALESLVDYANKLLEQVQEQSDQGLAWIASLADQFDKQQGSEHFSHYLSDLIDGQPKAGIPGSA